MYWKIDINLYLNMLFQNIIIKQYLSFFSYIFIFLLFHALYFESVMENYRWRKMWRIRNDKCFEEINAMNIRVHKSDNNPVISERDIFIKIRQIDNESIIWRMEKKLPHICYFLTFFYSHIYYYITWNWNLSSWIFVYGKY